MTQIVVYEKSSGEIRSVVATTDSSTIELYETDSRGVIVSDQEITFPCNYFIRDVEVIPRPTITATIPSPILSANAIDSIEISTLPNPCTITVNSDTYEVTDGVFEFTVDTPGTYIIKATCFPYQPKEWEVTAE